ncbi:MAG: hypothetical protein WCE73_05015 [Candidatus Angelobacter sp.]
MSFRMAPIGFVNDILSQVNAIRQELLGQNPPDTLFHYTTLQGVVGITSSRIVRAMSVASLKDSSEIHYGVNLVETEVERKSHEEISQAAKAILSQLGAELKSRISRTFVACFCASPASEFHWDSYGPYCLRFETDGNREPLLRVSVSGAQVGYFKAIYAEASQQSAIKRALSAVIAAVEQHTLGALEGPWAESMIRFLARNASELLLDIIVSFKKAEFWRDEEWRLVVRPNSALSSSAPDMADRNFDILVKRETKEYVELQIIRPPMLFQSVAMRSPVPFAAVVQSPFRNDSRELNIIERVLNKNYRADISVKRAPNPNL